MPESSLSIPVSVPVASLLFREGMSHVAGAVHIVTTDGKAGKAGYTATAVTPVSDAPPVMLTCLNASSRSAAKLMENGVFCINALSEADRTLADIFSGRTNISGAERFRAGAWERRATGSPVLETSLVAFDCRLLDIRRVGTHEVIIGEVQAIRLGETGRPLLYHRRIYSAL